MDREMLRGQVEAEMDAARLARAQGNEGRARVCARRAAGHAIRAYREAIGGKDRAHSAYGLLRWIASLPEIEEPLRACAERLAARVTPEHVLPHPQDPLGDATLLIEGLIEMALPIQRSQEAEPGDSRHLTP